MFWTIRDCYRKSICLSSFWVVPLLTPRGFRVLSWKNLLFGLTFSSLLVLEDRIIHIKSSEISKLFGVFLIFHTRAFGAYGLNVLVKSSQEQIYQQINEEYSQRLTSNEIKTDPNKIPHDPWIDDVNCLVTLWEQKLLMWNKLENKKTRKLTLIGWVALRTQSCLQNAPLTARVFKRLCVTFTKNSQWPAQGLGMFRGHKECR